MRFFQAQPRLLIGPAPDVVLVVRDAEDVAAYKVCVPELFV